MLLNLSGVNVSFGGPPLLDHADLQIERGERVCLVGRNGAGKSTLLKVIAGELRPDEGEIQWVAGARAARLPQEVPRDTRGPVFDVVAEGLGEAGRLLREYQQLSQRLASEPELLPQLERVQHALEDAGGWQLRTRVETVISRLALDPEREFETLSGGLKRRVLLAQALVAEPDLLLLDEPTNHLDIDSIAWLEEFLKGFGGALLFITHDRLFLQRLATRIIELDRGKLTSWPGDYDTYLERKQAALEAESKANALFDKKLAEEEAWIRQGIKARRTRNEGRVRALHALREERRERRELQGKARMAVGEAEKSGKLVVEAEHVGHAYGGRTLIRDLSTTLMRGDKVGIIGPNGAGKTTLLNILLGRLEPQQGRVRLGTKLEVLYFDQLREQLDEEASVVDNVGGGSDFVEIDGKRKHIMGYLQDFLFPPQRARTPVKALSGGERNRLLLAKLFTRPANVMVLDEPTNDLDIESLELLEDLLVEYRGTVLLVSHDRAFLNNVVTSSLVFEGDGEVNEYVGGYDDWLRQRAASAEAKPAAARPAAAVTTVAAAKDKEKPRKLSYKDQRELDGLPQRIEQLEAALEALQQRLGDPELYRSEPQAVADLQAQLASEEAELQRAYARWEELEALRG